MSIILNNNVFLVLLVQAPRSGRPHTAQFPPLTNFSMAAPGQPAHVFDGVDYGALPHRLRQEYSGCYEEQHRCLLSRNYLEPVCAFNLLQMKVFGYSNLCALNVENCILVGRMYGRQFEDRKLVYVGDGARCEYYARRRRDADERRRDADERPRARVRGDTA